LSSAWAEIKLVSKQAAIAIVRDNKTGIEIDSENQNRIKIKIGNAGPHGSGMPSV